MRVEIQMKSGHGPWAKKEQTSKLIDLQKLFNQDQSSKAHQPTVPGQSWFSASPLVLTETLRGDRGWKVSLRYKITILCKRYRLSPCNAHRSQLLMFACVGEIFERVAP